MSLSRLAFEQSRGRTVVASAFASAPLRFLTPRNHGTSAWVYTTTFGGGIVGGDEIRIAAAVAKDARAVLSSQGSTRVFRSPLGCSTALELEVGPGALAAILPDPTSCFSGSRLVQRTEVRLAEGASLALADCVTAGRSARDGRWALARFHGALRVLRGGAAVVDEALLLDPAHGPLAARLGRFECLATVLLAGPLLAASAEAALAGIAAAPLPRGAVLLEAASPIDGGGALVRIAAASVQGAAARIRELFSALPGLLGDDPFARRA